MIETVHPKSTCSFIAAIVLKNGWQFQILSKAIGEQITNESIFQLALLLRKLISEISNLNNARIMLEALTLFQTKH